MTNFPNDPFRQGGNSSIGTMYVQPGDGGGYAEPAKTSLLAILALILGILGFLVCWVPVGGLVIGALVVFLSIGAFLAVSGSGGRKKGKGLAVGGFVLGLINVVLGVSCVVGMGIGGRVVASYSEALTAANSGDVDAFNAYMAANSEVTKAELDAFVASYQPTMGDFKDAPPSFMQIFRAFVTPAVSAEIQGIQQANAGRQLQTIPVIWNFDKGEGVVIMVTDQTQQSPTRQLGLMEDVIIIDKATGTVVTRLSDVITGGVLQNIPGESAPGNAAPGNAAPGNAAPGEAAPGEGSAGDGSAGGDAAGGDAGEPAGAPSF